MAERWTAVVEGYREIRELERRTWARASWMERVETLEGLISFLEEIEHGEAPEVAQPFQEMLRRLHNVLETHGFPYVIIRGLATAIWGAPRTTADVDVVLLIPEEKGEDLLHALEEAGFMTGPDALLKLKGGRPVKLAFTRRFSVDLRVASFHLDREAIRRAREVSLFGLPLRFAAPEDLIVYKLARWDPIDQSDVRSILESQRAQMDVDYLEEMISSLAEEAGIPALWERWSHLKEEISG